MQYMDAPDPGTIVEEDIRRVIAELGVADFIYVPPKPVKGGANREVGDALLVANGMGAVLQIKARDPDVATTDTAARADGCRLRTGRSSL